MPHPMGNGRPSAVLGLAVLTQKPLGGAHAIVDPDAIRVTFRAIREHDPEVDARSVTRSFLVNRPPRQPRFRLPSPLDLAVIKAQQETGVAVVDRGALVSGTYVRHPGG